jgi:hypothetical protein
MTPFLHSRSQAKATLLKGQSDLKNIRFKGRFKGCAASKTYYLRVNLRAGSKNIRFKGVLRVKKGVFCCGSFVIRADVWGPWACHASSEGQESNKVVSGKKKKKNTDAHAVAVLKEPLERKRARSKTDVKDFIDATRARSIVARDMYVGQGLEEKEGRIWCNACNKNVRFEQTDQVKGHVFGQQKKGRTMFSSLSEEEKLKLRHYANLQSMQRETKKLSVINKAVQAHRETLFKASNETVHAAGSTLPSSVQAMRVNVLEAFWALGIPVSKMRDERLVHQ